MRRIALVVSLLFSPAALAEPGPIAVPAQWAAASRPSAGPPRVIGGYSLGCVAGAQALAADGPGWQVVRLQRNRFWGHPALLGSLRDLAGRAQARGLPPLLIGDLGQPRGGPMPYGHASHQLGLDADIWLDVTPRGPLSAAAREDPRATSLVLPDETAVDPRHWRAEHAALIRLAAELPGVDRIFVNHAIKRELCRVHGGEAWLRRVRPWRGHDAHMHIRLSCPPGQPDCHGQAPVPPGDGCEGLDWWLSPDSRRRPPGPPGPPPRLPAACRAVLEAPAAR